MSDRIREAFQRAWLRTERRQYVDGLLGRHNADGSVTYVPTGRKLYKYVTIRQSNGAQTAVPARDDVGVPHSADLPVRMRLENTTYIIEKIIRREDLASTDAPPASGVPIHLHTLAGLSDVRVTDPADGEILEWDATSSKFVNVTNTSDIAATIHAATGKATPVDADELALVDSAASNVLKKLTWANLKATVATYYNSLAATLTNKTLDSTNISTLTSKTTPVDADSVVLVDSAASNVFKRVTGTNWKAYAKTYFDTLYDKTATIITALSTKTTPVDADAIVITDSAASDAPKRVTYTNVKAFLKTYFDTLYTAINTAVLLTGAQTIAGVKTFTDAMSVTSTLSALRVQRDRGASGAGHISTMVVKTFTTASSSDGFGPFINFLIGDAETPEATIGLFGAERRGGDTTGDVIFSAFNSGVEVPLIRAAHDSKVLFGGLVTAGASNVGMVAGTSSNDAAVGGVLTTKFTTTGNVGTGEDVLWSYSVPADTLAVNGQSLEIVFYVEVANNFNAKTLRIKFGGTTIDTIAYATGAAYATLFRLRIIRTGATSQLVIEEFTVTAGGSGVKSTTAAETLSGAVTFQVTGEATSNNDVVLKFGEIAWRDVNS